MERDSSLQDKYCMLRRRYQAPALTHYGPVRLLTCSGPGSGTDVAMMGQDSGPGMSGGMGMSMS